MRAHGMGARVMVTEVNPLRALEAVMDGYQVAPMAEAAPLGDVFVTLTGDVSVIRREHFLAMKDGAIVANAGHFNVELDLAWLRQEGRRLGSPRADVEEFALPNGRRIFVLGEGRLVNLAAGEGHPASVMDMSFANQALAAEYLVRPDHRLERKVYPVPPAIDREVARLKLAALQVSLDRLTPEQEKYLSSWEAGT
jgi:adenosylhomocysteinase